MVSVKYGYGMTLVELLIAIALGGLLTGLLANILDGVRTGWATTRGAAIEADDQLSGTKFLFSSLTGAFAPDPHDQNTWFYGTRDRIEYVGSPPEAEMSRGRIKVKMYVAYQENGRKALIAETRPASTYGSMGTTGVAKVVTILKNVDTVTFSFSDMHSGRMFDLGPWGDPKTLPKLIRVELLFANKPNKPLNLTIAPRRNISGACVFDMVSLSCRT